MKATWGVVGGEEREIFKDPITDDGLKKSAKGLLRVGVRSGGDSKSEYHLEDQVTKAAEQSGHLETVFEDGVIIKETTLAEIRNRVKSN